MAEPYATLDDLKRMRSIADAADDELLTLALSTASRRIDDRCGRRFGLSAPSPRVYGAAGRVTPDGRLLVDDIGSLDGLLVETGWGTSWSPAAGWDPGPPSAPGDGWPYTELVGHWAGRVRVTARWGWPEVPEAIRMATLLLASRLFLRKNSPEGVLQSAEWGSIRVSRWDPDVDALLAPYIQPKLA